MTFKFIRKKLFTILGGWYSEQGNGPGLVRLLIFKPFLCLAVGYALILCLFIENLPLHAQDCPSRQDAFTSQAPTLGDMVNPNPSEADIELPMPCGGKLLLRHVCVPAEGYFEDLEQDFGCKDCGRLNQSFMESKHSGQ